MRSAILTFMIVFLQTKHIWADAWEIRAQFTGIPPAGCYVVISPVTQYSFYDLASHGYQNIQPTSAFGDEIRKTKILGDFNDTKGAGTDGTVKYGQYFVLFQDENFQTIGRVIVDFRDADYNPDTQSPYSQFGKDFEVTFDYDTQDGTVFRRGHPQYSHNFHGVTSQVVGIWELPDRTPNTLLFKNIKLSPEGFNENPTYSITVNGSSVSTSGNNPAYTGVGLTNPVIAAITAPNRIPSVTEGLSFLLSKWNGTITYDSLFNYSFNGNAATNMTLTYLKTSQDCDVAGLPEFGNSNPILFQASAVKPLTQQDCRFTWYIKKDAIGYWQQLGNSDTSGIRTVTPDYNPNGGFYVKCWMKDTVRHVAVWSNTFRSDYAPPLSASIEGPISCIPQYSNATWFSEPEGGNGSYTYEWKKDNEVVGTSPTLTLQVVGGFTLKLKVTSVYGTQIVNDSVNVRTSCGGGGCPFVFSHTESGLVKDNNILHRSEFQNNVGRNITDLYKLNAKPMLDGDRYKLTIQELDQDHSYFDGFRLYAIDHPEGSRIAVTQSNDIVMYSPSLVVSPDQSRLYGLDMTTFLGYQRNYGIVGLKSDTLSFTFPMISDTYNQLNSLRSSNRKDSLALLATMGHPQTNLLPKEMAAQVETENGSLVLANRQSESDEVLPLSDLPRQLSLIWNQDYSIRSVGLTRVFYDGFTKTELPLIDAVHSLNGDSKKLLTRIDSKFAELQDDQTLVLSFKDQNEVPKGWIRDFILETNGYYTTPHQLTTLRKDVLETTTTSEPMKFGLVGNYPNPFNPSTSLVFDLAVRSRVQLDIYNILGQKVRSLHDATLSEGRHTLVWDGKNDEGNLVPSGTYIWQLQTGGFVASKKILLIK